MKKIIDIIQHLKSEICSKKQEREQSRKPETIIEAGESDQIVLESINRFIQEKMYHYALLIDGEWGSGKTYFVQNCLIPHLRKEKRDVNYISLYGVKNTSEIGEMLCIQAIKQKFPQLGDKMDTQGGQILSTSVVTVARFIVPNLKASEDDIGKLVQLFPNYDNNVIILDDVERCGCDINELLGFINNFVEHSDASVILVANEKEIGKWQLDRNPELQMLVALNPATDIPASMNEEEQLFSYGEEASANKEKGKYSVTQIEERRRAIFNSNEKYLRMKEKVVGQTIRYEPDIDAAFSRLIEKKIKNTILKKQLIDLECQLSEMARKQDHLNLRTFQFYLEKISGIFSGMELNADCPMLFTALVIYTYRSAIQYMKGLQMPKWDGEYGNQVFDGDGLFSLGILGFRFIDDYIVSNHLDLMKMNNVLTQCCISIKEQGNLENDPSQRIKNWYEAEDQELSEWLEKIAANIGEGNYSTACFTSIIYHIAIIASKNVLPEQCNKIKEAMIDYINSADISVLKELDPEHFFTEGDSAILYQKWSGEVKSLLCSRMTQSEKIKFEEAVADEENWERNLENLAANTGIVRGHSFVYWLEPDKIVELLKKSKNKQIQTFLYSLQNYYGNRVYYENMPDDKVHLEEIKKMLSDYVDLINEQAIKKYLITLLIDYIDRSLEKIRIRFPEK